MVIRGKWGGGIPPTYTFPPGVPECASPHVALCSRAWTPADGVCLCLCTYTCSPAGGWPCVWQPPYLCACWPAPVRAADAGGRGESQLTHPSNTMSCCFQLILK